MPQKSNLYNHSHAKKTVNSVILAAAVTGVASATFALLVIPGISVMGALVGGILAAALAVVSNFFWGLSAYQKKHHHHHHHHHHHKQEPEAERVSEVQQSAEKKLQEHDWRNKSKKTKSSSYSIK